MKNKFAGIKIAALYTSVILGAGFVSGQELMRYFVGYGISGVYGLMAAGLLFSVTGWAVLDICYKKGLRTYTAFTEHLLGKKIGFITEIVVAVFLCVLFAAMLAAGGATMKQSFNWPFSLGAGIAAVLCFVTLLSGLDGVVKLNVILAPFMIIGGILIGIVTFFDRTVSVFSFDAVIPGWALAALIYASYNLVTGIPILTVSSKLAESPKSCRRGGIWGGASLTLLGLCLALPLFLHYKSVSSAEIPLLMIVMRYGKFFTGLYLAVIICAVFTTAVSNAFAFMEWFGTRFIFNRKTFAFVLCAVGFGAAHAGFSNIVAYAYPVFGCLGVFETAVILLSWRFARRDIRA